MEPITRADPPHVVTPPEPERQEPPAVALQAVAWVATERTADSLLHAHWARNRRSRNRA